MPKITLDWNTLYNFVTDAFVAVGVPPGQTDEQRPRPGTAGVTADGRDFGQGIAAQKPTAGVLGKPPQVHSASRSKKLLIPDQKAVYAPDLPPAVAAVQVLVQHTMQRARVKELRRCRAAEHGPHPAGVGLLPQPVPHRHRKAELFTRGAGGGLRPAPVREAV